ncbi:hypothetical protein NEIPOLOT_02437 [Neisseria polysaccharea ATCC 43768]|nr:hypothetical protein NEIPOLOT_02437 [Neisseria polysaccharea ATCC 43768]
MMLFAPDCPAGFFKYEMCCPRFSGKGVFRPVRILLPMFLCLPDV